MPPIVLSRITPKQILTIKNGINSYLYIKSNYDPFDNDFRDVFTDFYLSAQGVMKKPGNRNPYFAEMDVCKFSCWEVRVFICYKTSSYKKYKFSYLWFKSKRIFKNRGTRWLSLLL